LNIQQLVILCATYNNNLQCVRIFLRVRDTTMRSRFINLRKMISFNFAKFYSVLATVIRNVKRSLWQKTAHFISALDDNHRNSISAQTVSRENWILNETWFYKTAAGTMQS